MQPGVAIAIHTGTDVAASRRAAHHLAQQAEFSEIETGNLAIVVTEAATNVLKHGGGGEILLHRFGSRIEITALDKGPGTDNAKCFEDGFSTSGTPGSGLGAVSRLSSFCDLYSVPGCGTVLVAHVNGQGDRGVINIPYPGEEACGDTWVLQQAPDRTRLFVVDGLGHGIAAAVAAHAAAETVEDKPQLQPADLLETIHSRLRSTRGAAASVADILSSSPRVEFAGVGNVSGAVIVDALTRRQMISTNGILGQEVRRIQTYSYPVVRNSPVVLHSDGISANWSLDKYPGLFSRHPSVIAAVLFRDFRRHRDDATILVARAGESAARKTD